MRNAPSAGVLGALEIDIRRKTHRAVDGTETVVVADFSLSVPAGGFAVLIGPSGCGKTTILRIVAGLDTAFAGLIKTSAAIRLGVVFQEPRLLPWRTVSQNIELARPDAAPEEIRTLAERLGLGAVLTRYPAELSLGLARRVSLARALAVTPSLLLLDEPFVSLDDASANQMREAVADFAADAGATVLMVTHDVTEAIALADTLVVLDERPTKVLETIDLPPPRGARSSQQIHDLLAKVEAIQSSTR